MGRNRSRVGRRSHWGTYKTRHTYGVLIITAAIARQLKPAMNAADGEGTDCQASPTVREEGRYVHDRAIREREDNGGEGEGEREKGEKERGRS